jgi:large subunit ribosomal protein L4e
MVKKTVKVFNLEGKSTGKIELPPVFSTPLRPDVIKRAVLAIQSKRFQAQGRDPMAGKRTSAESRGTGMAMARLPRRKGSLSKAAFAPGTVSGRQGHPPLSEKIIVKNIPKKEKQLALRSAIAATASREIVASRGHSVEDVVEIPLVVTGDFEGLTKTKEVEQTLIHLGVLSELFRAKEGRGIRAGRGKSRGRKMKHVAGPLIVVNENKGIMKAAENLPGVNVVNVTDLNAEMLAPGTHPGRLTIWSSDAIKRLNELYGKGELA